MTARIVALTGLAGSGKSTAAKLMAGPGGGAATEIAFAEPLKRFCAEVFGFDRQQLYGPSSERERPSKTFVNPEAWAGAHRRLRDSGPAWLSEVFGDAVVARLAFPALERWFFSLMLPALGQPPCAYLDGAAMVALSSGHFTVVDAADYTAMIAAQLGVKIEARKHTAYAKASLGGYAHQVLMPDANQIDHVNGFGLDNRRSNLRACGDSSNHGNTRVKPGRFKGATYDKARGRWAARICVNRKTINLGRFATAREAADAYDAAAVQFFGDFAKTNPRQKQLTPRWALQTLGTEFGRDISADVWAKAGVARAKKILQSALNDGNGLWRVVITDLRFVNEARLVREAGGDVWRVRRPTSNTQRVHASEREVWAPEMSRYVTREISNTGTLEHLAATVRAAIAA